MVKVGLKKHKGKTIVNFITAKKERMIR